MRQKSVIVTSTLAALFALWNGLVIKWKLTGDQRWSKWWHGVGLVIRALPLYFIFPNWGWMLVYVNVAYTLYDEIINLVNGWGLGYIGSTATTDRMIGKAGYLIKAILLISTLIFFLL